MSDIEVISVENTQEGEMDDGEALPGCSTSLYIPTENDEGNAEGHLTDDNSEEDDDVIELVEVVSTYSNCESPCLVENDEFATESMETSTAMETNSAAGTSGTIVIKDSKDYSQWTSGLAERRALKRKSYCLENESVAKIIQLVDLDDTTQTTEENNPVGHDTMQGLKMRDYQLQCINFHCRSGYDLVEAPVFVLTYFGETRKKNVSQKVCDECFKIALRHQQDVIFRLMTHKPLFGGNLPVQQDVVVMDPSEEKNEEELLPDQVVAQVRKHLPGLIRETVDRYDLDFQLDQAKNFLTDKLARLEANNILINHELDGIEKTLRDARTLIYKDFVPRMKALPSVHITEQDEILETGAIKIVTHNPPEIEKSASKSHDIVSVEEIKVPQDKIPPIGPLTYPLLAVGDPVYIMRNTFFSAWVKGRILEVITRDPEQSPNYRVLFDTSCRIGLSKIVTGKQLAYVTPSTVRYPVGTRVIALFKNLEPPFQSAYYVGLIAEPPKHFNQFRYLVFFDDGYAQYVPHESILLVCECSKLVHEDIHPDSRDFIKKYLDRYPERPMVKLQQGQVVRTECDGKWWIARVVEIDGSLARLFFVADNREEWIYRGSTRLGPLYSELIAAAARKEQGGFSRHRGLGISSLKKKNMPYVEYSFDQDEAKPPNTFTNINKNVARKATSSKMNTEESSLDKNSDQTKQPEKMEHTTKGYIRTIDLSLRIKGRTYNTHECDPTCTEWTNYSETDCKGINPLAIPLFYGFERQALKCKGKTVIMYRAPCGKRLRTMMEVHSYLSITSTPMGVDLFDFDDSIRILDEFYLDSDLCRTYLEDISYGLERNPVSCVNEIGHFWPVFMDYSTSRIPMEGVNINLDEEFLVCCSCTDDCQDKQKCECWQLTFEGTKIGPEGISDPSVGYQFKRLLEPVTTGIYECNKRCKCSSTCFNRVAQCPLKLNLQVFRTLKKGWGLRTLNDIPEGGFICIYAGRLHTEQSANNDGRMYGDEYLAELDYIEVVERFKEGYESEVVEPTEKNDEDEDDNDKLENTDVNMDDTDYIPEGLNKLPQTENVVNTRARQKKFSSEEKSQNEGGKQKGEGANEDGTIMEEDDDEMKKKPSKFSATVPDEEPPKTSRSVREMFGDGADDCYVMDAKSVGNIGRYLNHSCQPNVFVQNVFVDTHDVRFPWVAFFALTQIKAGTELTWDYNYDIGSVPDKDPYQNVKISRRGVSSRGRSDMEGNSKTLGHKATVVVGYGMLVKKILR